MCLIHFMTLRPASTSQHSRGVLLHMFRVGVFSTEHTHTGLSRNLLTCSYQIDAAPAPFPLSLRFYEGKPKVQDNQPTAAVLEKVEPSSPFSLAPSQWLVMMDVGREKGTWMPQNWGISGRYDVWCRSLLVGDLEVEPWES